MINIDGVRKLKSKHMKEFINALSDTDTVYVFVNGAALEPTFNKTNLREAFENEVVKSQITNDNDDIIFAADEVSLMIAGIDFTWWNTDSSSLDKLFGAKKKKSEPTSVDTTLKIAAGTLTDAGVIEIVEFEGSKKDAISFINETYCKKTLRSKFEAVIVFNIAYDSEEALHDVSNWFTFEQLEEAGIFEVKQ